MKDLRTDTHNRKVIFLQWYGAHIWIINMVWFCIASLFRYWYNNREFGLPIFCGIRTQEQQNWWRKEIDKLNKRRAKIDIANHKSKYETKHK